VTRWKAAETAIAKRLGGKRVPISGRARGDVPDIEPGVEFEWLSVEVKNREAVPLWLLDGMKQAHAAAKEGQLPVVILHKVGTRYSDSILCLSMSDFELWFGGPHAL